MSLSTQHRWYIGGSIAVLMILWLSFQSNMMGSFLPLSNPTAMMNEAGSLDYAPTPSMAVRGKMMGSEASLGIVADSFSAGDTAATAEARVIRNASLSLLVDNIPGKISVISEVAQNVKGYVEHSNSGEQPDGTRYGYVTIRVPDKEFMNAVAAIRAQALRIQDDSITAQDVTEQYTDLQAQLHTAQAEEQAYLGLLARSGSVNDLLQVQRELSQVRSRIESLQGRIKYLENQTDYSTISVNLSEDRAVTLPTKPFRLIATIREAATALVQVAQGLVTTLVWLIIVGAPIAIVGWGVWATVKRWKR